MTEWQARIVALAAAVAAAVYLVAFTVPKVRRAYQAVRAAVTIVNRELTNNGGQSVKDEVQALTISFRALSKYLDGLENDLADHKRKGHP